MTRKEKEKTMLQLKQGDYVKCSNPSTSFTRGKLYKLQTDFIIRGKIVLDNEGLFNGSVDNVYNFTIPTRKDLEKAGLIIPTCKPEVLVIPLDKKPPEEVETFINTPEPVFGVEYEFSDYDDFRNTTRAIYAGRLKNYYLAYISHTPTKIDDEYKQKGYTVVSMYTHIRPIPVKKITIDELKKFYEEKTGEKVKVDIKN